MKNYIHINKNDSVAVAVKDLKKDLYIKEFDLKLNEDIKKGHKFAITDILKNDDIIKYNMPIGHAIRDIKKGDWVHTHNTKTNLKDVIDYEYKEIEIEEKKAKDKKFFEGFLREDGKAGIRNDIWIIPTVGCINKLCSNFQKLAQKKYPDQVFKAIEHNKGCSQLGDDLENTQKILAGIVNNPNAAGILILALGCENNQLDEFKKFLDPINNDRIKFLKVQEVKDEVSEAILLIDQLKEYADTFERQKLPISKLTIGFKCGGSDGFSGITANPVCGYTSDKLVSYEANTMLTEVPEMFGAEKILLKRAKTKKIYEDMINMINNFKQYFKSYGQTIYENPSPGNKDGGITTLEDKSLGCIQKGGNSPISGVLEFGQTPKTPGLYLLNGPGNDQVSSTNLVASGCNIIVFTTGRGNPFGSIVPTIKVSSNNELYNKKRNWIDLNAGEILEESNMDLKSDDLLNLIVEVANGSLTKNEINGFEEISIFKNGVIL
ncbi:MAG: altronate dehydratase family protein [Tissierellia bacterium]|nr:altronate dehydratase family protein [Tissierellia bacterium]